MSKSGKGPAWERELCGKLSLWFSEGESDSWFWRSSGSGARAKVRGRKGKSTSGHHGDITTADPRGNPLIQFTIPECKKGYSSHTIGELLDKPLKAKQQLYEGWIQQAEESRKNAGVPYWWLIIKRDRRESLIFMPQECSAELLERGATFPIIESQVNCTMRVPGLGYIDGFQLQYFLSGCSPKIILSWYRDFMEKRAPKVVEPYTP
jgi:hypothetical protein